MNLEQDIQDIRERNIRVELDKGWELSWTRRISILLFTYTVATVWLLLIENPHPFLSACVPAGGYFLSTLSLSFFKNIWIHRYGENA